MKRIAATLMFVLVVLPGCRSPEERSALARTPDAPVPTIAVDPMERPPDRVSAENVRRVWAGSDISFYRLGAPTPDGRYMIWIDDSPNLQVRDLATGMLHPITDNGTWDEAQGFPVHGKFSLDGRRVAYAWASFEDHFEIRVSDFAVDDEGIPQATKSRVVYSSAELLPYLVHGWSQDDRLLVTVYRGDRTQALALISVEDGDMEILKSFDWRSPRAVISPDGRYVAYDLPPQDDAPEHDVFVLSADGTREIALIDDPGDDRVLGWSPGGSLLVSSERSGSPGVWRIPMAAGDPAGPPELIHRDAWNLQPLGFGGDVFYFGVIVDFPTFHTAALDVETGNLLSDPVRIDDPYGGRIRALDWSRDGSHVVHDAVRPAARSSDVFWVVVREADGDLVDQYRFDFSMTRWMLRWAPDGRSVFVFGNDPDGRTGLRRIDLESGEMEIVRRFDDPAHAMGGQFALTPDGKEVYFRVRGDRPDGDERPPWQIGGSIVARDLETGVERRIRPVRANGNLELSPDGAWLVFRDAIAEPTGEGWSTLMLVPADGGEARELFRAEGTGQYAIYGMDWTADGQTIVFRRRQEVWKVSVEGGDAEKLNIARGTGGVRMHPDGRRITFHAGESLGEIWAMDGIGAETAAEASEGSR